MPLLDTHKEDIERHLARYPDKQSAVMPLLAMAQEEYGYVTQDAIDEIAGIVDLDVTHIKGLIGFYSMLYDRPKGKYLLQVCTDLPCALQGAEELSQHLCRRLGIQPGKTTPDGLFTVENVKCIAACDCAPVVQVNGHYHENVDVEKLNKLLEDLRREAEVSEPAHFD